MLLACPSGCQTLLPTGHIQLEKREERQPAREEWAGLDELLGAAPRPAGREARHGALQERNRELVRLIRETAGDSPSKALLVHLLAVTRQKLAVTNPGLSAKA